MIRARWSNIVGLIERELNARTLTDGNKRFETSGVVSAQPNQYSTDY